MKTFPHLFVTVLSQLKKEGKVSKDCDFSSVLLAPPKDPKNGDFSTNFPFVLSRSMKGSFQDWGALLIQALNNVSYIHSVIENVWLSGGFLNVKLTTAYWQEQLSYTLKNMDNEDRFINVGKGERINIEYVSANPTGPLHAGHGRIAVIADVLANLLEKVGYHVTREYYINDQGGQVDTLARSVYGRYKEALRGDAFVVGENEGEYSYPGAYIKDIAQALIQKDSDFWLNKDEEEWKEVFRDFSVFFLMQLIKRDLLSLGIKHDVFFSERSLHKEKCIEASVDQLQKKGLIYFGKLDSPQGGKGNLEQTEPIMLFRSTKFGDDLDRALKKHDGEWSYFAADIAYHSDKFRRGYSKMINVWGADHGSYVKRMKAAIGALTDKKGHLHVILCQIVNFIDQGISVKMSKRAGSFVTIDEVINVVGKDVFRFIMLTRKPDAHFSFDFNKVCENSKDNPVFYVQYAHARACSVLRMVPQIFPHLLHKEDWFLEASFDLLCEEQEVCLIKKITEWPYQVERAAYFYEPHRLATYLYELAECFHSLWNVGSKNEVLRFIAPYNQSLTKARVALVYALKSIVAEGLEIFGVEAVQELR